MVHYASGHCNSDKTRNLNSTLNERVTSIMLPSYRCLYSCTPLWYEFSKPWYLHWKMSHHTFCVNWFAYFNRKNIVGIVFLMETFKFFSFLGFPAHLAYVKSTYCRAENYAFLRHIYEIVRDQCCFPNTFLVLSEFYLAYEFWFKSSFKYFFLSEVEYQKLHSFFERSWHSK